MTHIILFCDGGSSERWCRKGEEREAAGQVGERLASKASRGFPIVLCIVGSSNLFIFTSFLFVIFGLINQCFLHNISLSRCIFDIGIYTINFVLLQILRRDGGVIS